MSRLPTLTLTRNGLPLGHVPLAEAAHDGPNADPAAVNELQPCGFQVDDREPDVEYRLGIGDRDPGALLQGAGRAVGLSRGSTVFWDDAPYFDGARGRVWVSVASRPAGLDGPWTPRARLPVYVMATKLSEERYRTMLVQLRGLAAGLVFDLASPMLRRLCFGEAEAGVSHRSSQVELRLLERLWRPLASSLLEVAREPATRLARVREIRLAWGGERFGGRTTAQLSAEGFDPRRPGAPRPFRALQERVVESLDTVEHQVIAGLLQFLRQRVASCAADVHRHIAGIRADRPLRERLAAGGPSLYDVEDRPRLERLRAALARASGLDRRIARALALAPFRAVPARFSLPSTPVFEHVRPYRRIREEFRRYLRSSLILLEEGSEERLKSTQRMYEQWVFFQLAGAFRGAGLRCANHDGLFRRARRFRYTLDVDRGARLVFRSGDGRSISLRFEPWILPYGAARQREDALYRGTRGESAWSPDILIEFQGAVGRAAAETPDVAYAVVVDAKYTARIQEHHWNETRKYLEIRATRTRRQVVKQLWLAYPSQEGAITPEDSSICWTDHGPDCDPEEVILGRLGLLPAARVPAGAENGPGWIGAPEDSARLFVQGLLNFLHFPALTGTLPEQE